MILIIDNYDSFVHNLARYIREAGADTLILRNDAESAGDMLARKPSGVVISPGPKAPKDAGVCLELLERAPAHLPILGVCLGHQCLVERFGGVTIRSCDPMHGEASDINHDGKGLFQGIASPMAAGRYHSLVSRLAEGNTDNVDDKGTSPLEACAWSSKGELMAVRHRRNPWHGVQFHPESLLTIEGRALIDNFLKEIRR